MKIKEGVFRTDIDRLFEMTETLSSRKLVHTPFIVLDDKEGVTLCRSAEELVAKFPLDTKILKQWKGEWSSDFLVMDVLDIKLALDAKSK